MKIKELKEFIKDLPDDMPVVLMDIATDDPNSSTYQIESDNLELVDYSKGEDQAIIGKGMVISFRNEFNEYGFEDQRKPFGY